MDKKDEQCSSSDETSFGFAFDDPTFSDRTLRLVIIEDPSSLTRANDTERSEATDDNDDENMSLKQIGNCVSELEEGGCSIRVKTLRVSSVILAAKSSYFRKLFTTEMKESEQGEVALQIYPSEEESLIDVIKFMYSSNLPSSKSPVDLMKLLVTADKFDVPSCVSHCCKLLRSSAVSFESAFSFINLPSTTVSSNETAQELVNAAKKFILANMVDIRKYHEHIMNLSLDGIKLLLSSNDLKVDTEDVAYDLSVQWLEAQYSDPEQRSKVFNSELCKLIRFPYMSHQKLKLVLSTSSSSNISFDPAVTTSIIQAMGACSRNNIASSPRVRRAYKALPVAVTTFEIPVQQCVVFLDLRWKECQKMTRYLWSQPFVLGGHTFCLLMERDTKRSNSGTFGMFLWLEEIKGQPITLDFEFATRRNTCPRDFVRLRELITGYKFEKAGGNGYSDLFGESWEWILSEHSKFFINGIMHLKVTVSIVSED